MEAHNFARHRSIDGRLNPANGQLVTGPWNWRGRYNWPLPPRLLPSASRDSNHHHARLSPSYARPTTRPSFRGAILFEISGNRPRPMTEWMRASKCLQPVETARGAQPFRPASHFASSATPIRSRREGERWNDGQPMIRRCVETLRWMEVKWRNPVIGCNVSRVGKLCRENRLLN